MSVLLAGGLVVDGSGAPPRRADVLVRDGQIAAIGSLDGEGRYRGGRSGDGRSGDGEYGEGRFDASGAVICPGFVDIHTHSDLTVLSGPQARSKVHQGVTTEVVGNCGLGIAPLLDNDIRAAVSYLDLDPGVAFAWRDTAGYLAAVRDAGPSVNVATLTGHLPLRAGVVGFDDRPATPAELARMRELLAESFAQGSLGLSTGLQYAPLTYAPDAELLALAETVTAHDRVFTWHIRDYADELLPAVRQALRVAKQAGCRTQISHLTAVGRRNWGNAQRALDLIDRADAEVGVDIYPYLYGNAPLAQLLPAWAQAGGAAATAERLRDPNVRDRIRAEWQRRPVGWDEITISRAPDDSLAGQGISSDDTALDLLAEYGPAVLMVAGGRSEDDLRAVLDHPAAVVASDGLCLDPDGVTGEGAPHPRSYGCFPRYLARYGKDMADAVARCTSRPARIAGIDRGVLREGAPADVVVFAPDRLADTATFTDPQRYPDGIELVLVGGEVVVEAGRHTGNRPGKVITR